MKIAVMQPYYFPYVGYFELIAGVDEFVIFDSAQYTRKGWINRNRIRKGSSWEYLTIPISRTDRKTEIRDVRVHDVDWASSHMASLVRVYGKKARSHPLYDAVGHCRDLYDLGGRSLVDFLTMTLTESANFLGVGLKSRVLKSSQLPPAGGTPSQKIVRYCEHLGADTYLNPGGGRQIYDDESFSRAGVSLKFMERTHCENSLSILDLCIGDGVTCLPRTFTSLRTVTPAG